MRVAVSDPDIAFLRQALRLAMKGRGQVEPNPMVGCVLVKAGKVIGEGFHTHFGGPHAEPTALASCTESPEGATAYVTLEPCCHLNKKTPPCTPRLIAARVVRVVIGCLDPNPDVNGKGIAMLREAGIAVDGPLLEGEATQLIEPFIKAVKGSAPDITLKWAESADGKVAGPGGKRTQITGLEANQLVHELRSRMDAIVVGIGTVLNDDPLLTIRGISIRRKPLRVVLDRQLRIPVAAQLVQTAHDWPTAVLYDTWKSCRTEQELDLLKAKGVTLHGHDVFATTADEDLNIAMHDVLGGKLSLQEVLVEPGPTLARRFFDFHAGQGCVDRLWVFRSPVRIGDPTAPDAAPIPDWMVPTGTIRVGTDELTEYRRFHVTDTDAGETLGPVPSVDFVLARESYLTN